MTEAQIAAALGNSFFIRHDDTGQVLDRNHKPAKLPVELQKIEPLECPDKVTLHQLMKACADHCGISMNIFLARRRDHLLVKARACYYYLAEKHTTKSLVQIGKACDKRDHATVRNGIFCAEKFPRAIAEIEAKLGLDKKQ